MKTLYEGILDDIEDTLQAGDKYVEAVKELDATKKMTVKDWQSVLDNDVMSYEIKCPKWLAAIGLPEFETIYFEITFYDEYIGDILGVDPEVILAIYDKDFIKSRIINRVMPGLPKCKTRAEAEKLVVKTIKNTVNSKNSEKLRKLILSQV